MNAHADEQTFRTWLVKQLVRSRWSAVKGEEPALLARRLGVSPSVLAEAVVARRSEAAAKGYPQGGTDLLARNDYATIRVQLPAAVRKDWIAFRTKLRLGDSTLLRSMIHHLLSTRARPQSVSATWLYRGIVYKQSRTDPRAVTRITRGAQIALDTYAREWRTTSNGITRGLMIDALEGRLQRFKIIAYSELWGDPDRYLHPEKFSDMRTK